MRKKATAQQLKSAITVKHKNNKQGNRIAVYSRPDKILGRAWVGIVIAPNDRVIWKTTFVQSRKEKAVENAKRFAVLELMQETAKHEMLLEADGWYQRQAERATKIKVSQREARI
jgi:hypothetical protein